MTADPLDPPPQFDVGDEVTIIIRGRVHSEYEAWAAGEVEAMLEVRFHGGLCLNVPQESADVEILATDQRLSSPDDARYSVVRVLPRGSRIDPDRFVAKLQSLGWRYFPPAM